VKIQKLSEKEKTNALNEVRILASIENSYVIGYKEAFFDDLSISLCIVMDFADGGDLYNRIVEHKKNQTDFQEFEVWTALL
jgi:NIMA (never in mitosis gene a)-related kinase